MIRKLQDPRLTSATCFSCRLSQKLSFIKSLVASLSKRYCFVRLWIQFYWRLFGNVATEDNLSVLTASSSIEHAKYSFATQHIAYCLGTAASSARIVIRRRLDRSRTTTSNINSNLAPRTGHCNASSICSGYCAEREVKAS